MNARELLNCMTDDLKTALGGKLPQLCNLERSTQQCKRPEEVKQILYNFQAQEGWLCFQSAVTYFLNGELPDQGVILYGEVKNEHHTALHIHQDGTGGWLLTTFREQPGEIYLVESTQFISELEHLSHLNYRLYWQQDGEQGYRPFCAAFDGFVKLEIAV